ncbi:MAG TPA: DUF2911 domain-containing protein [Longimicrobiales bacterium]|nr:DUF2911 domain-containing protein [Longimicrobiales bacterium]
MLRSNLLSALTVAAAVAACGGQAAEDDMEELDHSAMEGQAAVAGELVCRPTATGSDLAGRSSPYDSATIAVGEGQAKVCYSRPALRGRTMIGGEAVPYDTLWRTGANEPTIIHLSTAAEIAGMRVEPGSYSLYTVPRQGEEWTLIVNRSTSQWGHELRYTPEVRAQEVGRAQVHVENVEQPVEQFTIRAMEGGDTGLVIEWQNSRIHVPISPAA